MRLIRHYSGSKIYFTLNVVRGFRTLPNLAVVRVCIFAYTRGNTDIFAQINCRIVTYPLDKVVRPLNNWDLVYSAVVWGLFALLLSQRDFPLLRST